MISFIVPGQPVAKGRPRFAKNNGEVHTYTPKKTVDYETLVSWKAREAMRGRAASLKPIELALIIALRIPSSWSKIRKTKAIDGEILPTTKPDSDNVLKGVKDGCNKIVWRDDAQVVRTTIDKIYSETPRVEVRVYELQGECA